MDDTDNKYALITGVTSVVGYRLAQLFAEADYNLAIVGDNKSALEDISRKLEQKNGIKVVTFSKNLRNPEEAFSLYKEVISKGIEIDILVNDAWQGDGGKFVDTDLSRELEIIQLNISSLVILTKLFLKDMLKRGDGKILNLSLSSAKVDSPLQAVCHATKDFVHSFTECIRDEVKDTGVLVTALLPGNAGSAFDIRG